MSAGFVFSLSGRPYGRPLSCSFGSFQHDKTGIPHCIQEVTML